MSPKTPPTASPLDDYLDLLQALAEHGIEYVVMGGCAVAAYARQVGEAVFSSDLDLLVSQPALDRVLAEAPSLGLLVENLPHIEILRRFIVEEAVHAFQNETDPRARIAPAERMLAVLGQRTLDKEIAARLIPLAREAVDFRFLAHRAPTDELDRVVAAAPEALRADIARVAGTRGG